jgi:hypothetical protein
MLLSPTQSLAPTGVQRSISRVTVSVRAAVERRDNVASRHFYFGYWYSHWRA